MTASFAMSESDDHPEVTEISALTEGILPPARASEVQSHLSECALCADVRSSLEEIQGALGTLPGPVRMPEDVAGRIDAALAAEALLDSTTPTAHGTAASAASPSGGEDADAVSRETTPRAPRDDDSRETSPPVAASPGTAGAHARDGSGTRRPPGQPAGSSGPGRERGRTSRRRRRILLATAGACAALALGGVLIPTLVTDDSQQATDQGAEAQQPSDIDAAQLKGRVQDLLAGAPSVEPREKASESGEGSQGEPSVQEDQGGESDVGPKASPTAPFGAESAVSVPACVSEGIDRSEAPLAASRQSYEGSDSFLLVFSHPGHSDRVDAYVVDAACASSTSSASDAPGRVLANETVPRG